MTSALIVCADEAGAPKLASDLGTLGFQVFSSESFESLLQTAIKTAPDVVVCYEHYPSDALFLSISALAASAPRPVVVFTNDPDVEKIERAAGVGVQAYVVNGYGLNRLRSVIHVAQARFAREQSLRGELSDINQRFEERKLVDRAKGILMRAHQISEDQAFRALRTAAMHSKQRVGQVSQHIIESARYGEAVNRAGQLRMFSQRIVTLYALICADVCAERSRTLLAQSEQNVTATLALLGRTLSKATFGDLLAGLSQPWLKLKAMVKGAPGADRLHALNLLAEDLLLQAEQLVINLEIAGISQSLHVINVAGRQRMLCQRMAKEALLIVLSPQTDAKAARASLQRSRKSFVDTLSYLNAVPLATSDIADRLAAANAAWTKFEAALEKAKTPDGQQEIAESGEALVTLFDQLTDQYELGMQALMK